jgi:hypothetical protein
MKKNRNKMSNNIDNINKENINKQTNKNNLKIITSNQYNKKKPDNKKDNRSKMKKI